MSHKQVIIKKPVQLTNFENTQQKGITQMVSMKLNDTFSY